ncbi:MAG: inorganic phosphate transporter [Bacteroidetes bacterium]|nr:inorganic phosphate transporter [Bacteroidota bacterium]MBL0064721.1 inorganic phosphate transporter [Bacteroidota bacterium]MBL0137322.1 inorganic phosphate transporter [Bacteroidota bacterium]
MQLITLVIILALVFDFINGFHDAANSIATVVSTKVLSPLTAVIWAAAFNFLAYWIFELKVADTVAKTVNKENVTLLVVLSGVIAAIIWNLATWWGGIPSSSSHTLIGGFAGAGIANAGSFSAVQYEKVMPTIYFIVLAPVIGLVMSYIISVITINICKRFNPSKVDVVFRRLQLLSSAAYSLGHGGNDAQKVMGIIAAAMVSQGVIGDIKELPEWVPLACYTAIAAGTMIGGWKIVKTMGQKVTKLTPFEGFSAETAGALTLFGTQHFKIPVSTTHTITGAIIGVGVTKRVSAVRWGVTIQLIWAWVLTIPVSALLAAGIFYLLRMFMH